MYTYIWNLCSKIFSKSSLRRCSIKNTILKMFAIFTWKHLCCSLFLIKSQAFRSVTLLQRIHHKWFLVNIAKILRTTILKNICDRLLYIFLLNDLHLASILISLFLNFLNKNFYFNPVNTFIVPLFGYFCLGYFFFTEIWLKQNFNAKQNLNTKQINKAKFAEVWAKTISVMVEIYDNIHWSSLF